MFTVKAVRAVGSAPLEEFAIFEAGWVDVRASTVNGSPPYIAPDYSVSLFDKAPIFNEGDMLSQIEVGHGEHQYHTVYVLNEKGRTVQTVKALNRISQVCRAPDPTSKS